EIRVIPAHRSSSLPLLNLRRLDCYALAAAGADELEKLPRAGCAACGALQCGQMTDATVLARIRFVNTSLHSFVGEYPFLRYHSSSLGGGNADREFEGAAALPDSLDLEPKLQQRSEGVIRCPFFGAVSGRIDYR